MRCISCVSYPSREQERFCHQHNCISTNLVHDAVWQIWKPSEILLCIGVPEQAPVVGFCQSQGIPASALWIPDDRGEDSLWETFSRICSIARPGEEILLDITGGRHTLPFIFALAAVWMKEVLQVQVKGIVYATGTNEFGLRHFVDLRGLTGVIHWISGVQALTSYMDADQIQTLLTGLQGKIHREADEPDPPTRMSSWAHLLGSFTTAVRLSRPVDALYAGWGITRDLPVIEDELRRFAPSLLPVLSDIADLDEMGSPPPEAGLTPEYLMKQHQLILYQIQAGLAMQAVSLSREWLISCMFLIFGDADEWLNADTRHEISWTLTGLALTLQGKNSETTRYTRMLLDQGDWKEMVQVWERVSDLRNDLAHCGMNTRGESLRSLLRRTSTIPDDLKQFIRYAGIDRM